MEKILLASASPRRKEILKRAGVIFEVRPSQKEEIITEKRPEEAVKELARQKAASVLEEVRKEEDLLVIGADTIVSADGEILGKPRDEKDAAAVLERLQGRTHQVYTGVCVLAVREGKTEEYVFAECTEVEIYPMEKKEIAAYIATKEPMDKAGSYGIQGSFSVYVKGIRGDYYNVVGLPVSRLFWEMKQAGIRLRKEETDEL